MTRRRKNPTLRRLGLAAGVSAGGSLAYFSYAATTPRPLNEPFYGTAAYQAPPSISDMLGWMLGAGAVTGLVIGRDVLSAAAGAAAAFVAPTLMITGGWLLNTQRPPPPPTEYLLLRPYEPHDEAVLARVISRLLAAGGVLITPPAGTRWEQQVSHVFRFSDLVREEQTTGNLIAGTDRITLVRTEFADSGYGYRLWSHPPQTVPVAS